MRFFLYPPCTLARSQLYFSVLVSFAKGRLSGENMTKYRDDLPLIGDDIFLIDGGLETTLVFHERMELPEFAAFVLLQNEQGRKKLVEYFNTYLSLAKRYGVGFVLESPTWRASSRWGGLLGYSEQELEKINRQAISLLGAIRDEQESDSTRIVISGCIGPKGDGYVIDEKMTENDSERYHLQQITTFSNSEADLVSAYTISYVEEAIGIVRAARSVKMPVVIGFTVETDGRLPSGQSIEEAIETVDMATGSSTAYYMINCAHPTHFRDALDGAGSWKRRIRAVRANASSKSHAELDEAEELDAGSPSELGQQYRELKAQLINLTVLGGCCGTDRRHIQAICEVMIGKRS